MRRLLASYLLVTLGLIVFFIVLHYVEFVDDFLDRGATMRDVFLVYYPNFVPEIVRLTSPLALFLACVHLTGRLAQTLQLTALKASGVSLYRLLLPFAFIGALLAGANFWLGGYVTPLTQRAVLDFEQRYLANAPRALDITDVHRQNAPGSFVAVGYYDRLAQRAHRVTIHGFSDGRLAERIDAPIMAWVDSLRVWRLEDAVVRTFDPTGSERRRDVERLDTTLQVLPRDFARTERDVESMTIPAAAEYVDALQRSGAGNVAPSLVAYYAKFSYPVALFILILIGVPLASVRRRGGQAVQLGLGLVTAFIYLAVLKLTEPFGYSGEVSPLVVAWLPHMAFLGLALILLARART